MSLTDVGGAKIESYTVGSTTGDDSDCNGIDDNGDGIPDNNYIPVQTNCGLGVCESVGQIECLNGSKVNTCEPDLPTEQQESTCNDDLDNDCDGLVDKADQSCSPYIYVEPFGVCGGNWPCYSKIQDGINSVGIGSTIKVAQGTYYENIVIDESKEVALIGGWDSSFIYRVEDLTRTIIDGNSTGDGIGDESVFSVLNETNERTNIIIEGFVIRNGYAHDGEGINIRSYDGSSITLIFTNNTIMSNRADGVGGGVFIFSDSNSMVVANLINNTITANSAGSGGGLYIGSIESSSITADITGSTILANTALIYGADIFIYENDIYGDSTTVVNTSHSDIGNVYLEGWTYNDSAAQ